MCDYRKNNNFRATISWQRPCAFNVMDDKQVDFRMSVTISTLPSETRLVSEILPRRLQAFRDNTSFSTDVSSPRMLQTLGVSMTCPGLTQGKASDNHIAGIFM